MSLITYLYSPAITATRFAPCQQVHQNSEKALTNPSPATIQVIQGSPVGRTTPVSHNKNIQSSTETDVIDAEMGLILNQYLNDCRVSKEYGEINTSWDPQQASKSTVPTSDDQSISNIADPEEKRGIWQRVGQWMKRLTMPHSSKTKTVAFTEKQEQQASDFKDLIPPRPWMNKLPYDRMMEAMFQIYNQFGEDNVRFCNWVWEVLMQINDYTDLVALAMPQNAVVPRIMQAYKTTLKEIGNHNPIILTNDQQYKAALQYARSFTSDDGLLQYISLFGPYQLRWVHYGQVQCVGPKMGSD